MMRFHGSVCRLASGRNLGSALLSINIASLTVRAASTAGEGDWYVEPDKRTVCTEHVRSEDASEAGRQIPSHDSGDDWTIVDDASDTGAEPEAMEA